MIPGADLAHATQLVVDADRAISRAQFHVARFYQAEPRITFIGAGGVQPVDLAGLQEELGGAVATMLAITEAWGHHEVKRRQPGFVPTPPPPISAGPDEISEYISRAEAPAASPKRRVA